MSYRVPKLDGGNKLPAKYLPDTVATDAEVTAAVAGKADAASLAPVATAGTYSSLTGKPTIPATPADIGAQPAGSYATTTAGKVPDAQLPDRLQDTQLRAALVARPTGGTDGQALVKSGTDVVWGTVAGSGSPSVVDNGTYVTMTVA